MAEARPPADNAVALLGEELSVDAVVRVVKHSGAGAVVTFLGAVREQNDGHPVTLLEYEAYASMAVAEMRRIKDELERETPGVRVAVHHRVGALGVGELAVVCAASAPHRTEAFVACRALIDRVKARVPIWKREHGPDGPYWVGWEDARCHGHEHHHGHEHRALPAE
jgi:molybdopterin synthase catalytic subunit